MAIEIRELHIKINVTEKDRVPSLPDTDSIVEECVEKVLETLKTKTQR